MYDSHCPVRVFSCVQWYAKGIILYPLISKLHLALGSLTGLLRERLLVTKKANAATSVSGWQGSDNKSDWRHDWVLMADIYPMRPMVESYFRA